MENNQRNSRKRLNSLILLVAFTAVMLIVSTYAWFSAQKNVTISGIEGIVNVAEGLMISLDAKNWTQSLDFTAPLLDPGQTMAKPYAAGTDTYTYAEGANNLPAELIPVSGNGVEDLNANTEMSFYNGMVNSWNKPVGTPVVGLDAMTELYDITKVDSHISEGAVQGALDYPGFFAIDLFLQNSSKIDTATETQGTSTETLQLNSNSLLKLLNAGTTNDYITGLQNTTRVALARYDTTGIANSASTVGSDAASIYVTASQDQILQGYSGKKISDIAIWEPNASTHTENVVNNNNYLVLNTDDEALYFPSSAPGGLSGGRAISKFAADTVIPTFALTEDSLTAAQALNKKVGASAETGIADIYNWNTVTGTGMAKQVALQTDTEAAYGVTGVRNLVSVTSDGADIYELGNEGDAVEFQMLQNSIIKLRLYLWLEGQDPDTINQASHGGGVHLDLGLVKGVEPGEEAS